VSDWRQQQKTLFSVNISLAKQAEEVKLKFANIQQQFNSTPLREYVYLT